MKKILIVNYNFSKSDGNDNHLEQVPFNDSTEVPYLWLTLKSYYEKNSKDPSAWQWLDPIYSSSSDSIETLVQDIVSQSPDVLGISCYVWNVKLTLHVAEMVKQLLPSVKIIAGGPSLYYEHDKSWFKKHKFIDAVCEYSAYGEIFITEYLDGTNIKEVPFAVYPTLNGDYWCKSTAPYNKRSFKYPLPYYDNKEYIKKFAAKYKHIKLTLDTSRGCPYGCTFCEWGGGTSTKTVFKPLEDVIKELEVAFELLRPCYVDIINANYGIIKDDLIIAEKIVELNKKYNCVYTVNITGPSKTNKLNLLKIQSLFVENNIMSNIKLSLQHTNKVVLDNIKRIDMPCEEQLELYKDLCNTHDIPLIIEVIIGLPGDNPDTFYDMIDDLSKRQSMTPNIYEWVMLPSAPAADPSYIEKMQIKTKKVRFLADAYSNGYMTKSQYDIIDQRNGIRSLIRDPEWLEQYDIVISTYSYSVEDWAEMQLFKYYFIFLNDSKIITPIQKHLRSKNHDISEFYKSLFNDFLLSIPLIRKCYDDFITNIKSDKPSDIYYANIGDNLPYFSHLTLLKFLILLSPAGFFKPLNKWLNLKYGYDKEHDAICNNFIATIDTPMNDNMDEKQKIRSCISMCNHWTFKDI